MKMPCFIKENVRKMNKNKINELVMVMLEGGDEVVILGDVMVMSDGDDDHDVMVMMTMT